MRKVLTKAYIGAKDRVSIDDSLYASALIAKNNLTRLSLLEEKFDITLENFNEFEECLLTLTSRAILFQTNAPEDYYERRTIIDRRIINFLASAKMYSEQSKAFICKVFKRKSSEVEILDSIFEDLRNNDFGFKFCEYLRNFTLHVDLPTFTVGLLGERGDLEGGSAYFCIAPYIRLSSLMEDKNISKTLLQELGVLLNGEDEFDVRPFLRSYLGGLGKVHRTFRDLLNPMIDRWETTYSKLFDIVRDSFEDNSLNSIVIAEEKENTNLAESCWIVPYTIEHRKKLVQKNNTLNLENFGFVNNQIRKKSFTRKGTT